MESTTASKKIKRKVDLDLHDHHDDEEEKMEEFYALIKNIRESRDRLMINRIPDDQILTKNKNKEAAADDHDESNGKNKRKALEEEEEKQVVVWKPSFQREDFIADQAHHPYALSIATSTASQTKVGITTSQDQKEEVKDQGLDLTLSL
ncbi:hypothetical protein CCACVL1_22075 [Corchorus capsularis]|uniref:Uncharacterized protein n=1 Tax=Corchorus capsularis TaxID=210143 RepID=A0A1R3H1D6_COCAP|nr:hypothetical protein CCACVL1_22075 [Corchorus capsularis]